MQHGVSVLVLGLAFTAVAPCQIVSVVSGAGFDGPPSPGSIATIFGFNLTSATGSAESVPLPLTLANTSVMVNDTPAPLFYVSPQQINFQVPAEALPGVASVVVATDGAPNAVFSVAIPQAGPGIFTYGDNRAVATNQDGSLTDSNEPAAPGGVTTVYMTGLGPLDNPVPTNTVTPMSPVSQPSLPASATIGGKTAPISFIGLTPGSVGVAQANLSVPSLTAGNYAVVVTIGGVASNDPLITVGN